MEYNTNKQTNEVEKMLRRNRLFWSGVIVLILICFGFSPVYAASRITIKINEEIIPFATRPVILDDTIFMPVEEIYGALRARVIEDEENGVIRIEKGSTKIELVIGKKEAKIGPNTVILPTPPVRVEGRAMVPLRFAVLSMGANIEWDSHRQTVHIIEGNYLGPEGVHEPQPEQEIKAPRDIYEENKNAIVKIAALDKNGNERAVGSGFVVSKDGKVLTNYHVIHLAYSLKVIFNDDTSVIVKDVLMYDKERDFALFKLPGNKDVASVSIGEARKTSVGETVVTVGSPLGYTNSITSGLLSGKRIIGGQNLLQISSPISPGNSGGPLFNSAGKVIGIVQAKIVGGENMNIAQPIDNIVPYLGLEMKPKNLVTVVQEVTTDTMSLDEFGDYLIEKHGIFAYKGRFVVLDRAYASLVNDNTIGIIFTIDDSSYANWLVLKADSSPLLSQWMQEIQQETHKYYPGYDYLGMVVYVRTINDYPPSYGLRQRPAAYDSFYTIDFPVYTISSVTGFSYEKFE